MGWPTWVGRHGLGLVLGAPALWPLVGDPLSDFISLTLHVNLRRSRICFWQNTGLKGFFLIEDE